MFTMGCKPTNVFLSELMMVAGQSGCAFTHQRPTGSATPVDQPETIGLVLILASEENSLSVPEVRQTQGAAVRGMVQGFGQGLVQGLWCGLYFYVCSPALAVGGAVLGGGIGWSYEALTTEPSEAVSALNRVLVDLNVDEVVLNHLSSQARGQGYSLTSLPPQPGLASIDVSEYRPLAKRGIGTVLEVCRPTIELQKGVTRRRLVMSVNIRLIRTADGMVFGVSRLADDEGGTRTLAAWADHDAAAFREEISRAARRLAQQIVKEVGVERTLSPVRSSEVASTR